MWLALLPLLAHAQALDGTWRVDLHLVNDVQVPVLGHSPSDAYTVQRWQINGDRLTNEHCSIVAVTRRRIGKPTLPASFVRNIRKGEAPLRIDDGRLHVDMGESRIGFVGEVLPEGPTDAQVVDHENDGHPGATMQVWAPLFGEVDVYIAQRSHLVLDGVIDGDTVRGTAVQTVLDQRTLGAANRLFAQNPVLTPVEGRFTMTRVADGAGCDDPALASAAPQ